ncbi:MAG: methyltransferase domain-containing protein [Myxococcales bacterium]|nr:methyltransferase domain-containing protein [Myxococcales bacterium]
MREVGCGTGLATRSFAERGLRMLCLESDEPMAERARRNRERFENVELSRSHSGDDYCALLQTCSDHPLLEEQQRIGLLAGVSSTIEAHRGSIQLDYVMRLFMAVRVD